MLLNLAVVTMAISHLKARKSIASFAQMSHFSKAHRENQGNEDAREKS